MITSKITTHSQDVYIENTDSFMSNQTITIDNLSTNSKNDFAQNNEQNKGNTVNLSIQK